MINSWHHYKRALQADLPLFDPDLTESTVVEESTSESIFERVGGGQCLSRAVLAGSDFFRTIANFIDSFCKQAMMIH